MRIVVSGYIGKKVTGIGRNLICLLNNSQSNNEYIIYTNEDMKKDFSFSNPRVIVKTYSVSKDSSLKNLLWTTFIFPWKTLKEHADLSLIPNFTLLLFKFKPTVVIMHDLIEFNVPEKFSKSKMFYRTKIADPITARRADHIITVSENSKKDIKTFLKIDETKISVVYNGVDRSKFIPMEKNKAYEIIGNRGWPNDFLLYAGTIDHPGKNAMGVIRAYEGLKEKRKYNGNLILAGMPGSNYEAVDEYIKNSKYCNDIVLAGYVSDEELVALYSTCKVFVFISLYEGFGIPPLEALACGAKVVVSNTSSLPEVVGNVGWTVDPANNDEVQKKIVEALDCQENNQEKIENHLSQYMWSSLSMKFEHTLEKIRK